MNTVIKGTKTIAEFKELKSRMEQEAMKHFEQHKAACETWSHGDISKVWFDAAGNLCIEYEDGNYWHYNERSEWY